MFSRGLLRSFAFKVNARSIIAPSRGTFQTLSRAELKRKIEDPTYFEDRLAETREQEKEEMEKFHFALKANDSNPANLIKNLKIKGPQGITLAGSKPDVPLVPTAPDVIYYRRDPETRTVSFRLGRNKGSVKKITPIMRKIAGKHVSEALVTMLKDNSKVSQRVMTCLRSVRNRAVALGMNKHRLYVKFAITNRQKRVKGIRYHAKMRRGLEKVDWCSLYIVVQEKSSTDFFKELLAGKAPPSVVARWRKKIMRSGNFAGQVRKFQFILTAKGRQQRREMIKRRAYTLQQKLLVLSS